MQMEYVGFLRPGVQVAKPYIVAEIGMMNVGRIVAVKRADGFPLIVVFQDQRRIAICPRTQEKLFRASFGAILDRADILAELLRRHDQRAHAADAVIDAHPILD